MPSNILKQICSIVEEYFKKGYSLIPIDREKHPFVYWKKYQYTRATKEIVCGWLKHFSTLNIGIVTGCISQLAVVDLDDLSLLPALTEKLPEIQETARARTGRGYHYYFKLDGEQVRSTSCLFGIRLELKGNGTYIVAPPSRINHHSYTYEIPLSEILPIPGAIIRDLNRNDYFAIRCKIFKIPKYHGHHMDCIRQILKRGLKEGERDNSLFILYHLLLQNKNTKEYARSVVEKKNCSLADPLTEKELKKIYRRPYHYGCSGIREKLPYIRCDQCTYRFKGGQLKGNNILVKGLRVIPELTSTQRSIACLLGTVFDGEKPSIYQIAKKANIDWRIVKKTMLELKEKGFPIE